MCGRLDYYLETFHKLISVSSTSSQEQAESLNMYWCPLLLLAIIEHINSGTLLRNFISPSSELIATYTGYTLHEEGIRKQQPSLAIPFWNLQGSSFWHLRLKDTTSWSSDNTVDDLVVLKELAFGATLSEDLYALLLMQASRDKLQQRLIESYLPAKLSG